MKGKLRLFIAATLCCCMMVTMVAHAYYWEQKDEERNTVYGNIVMWLWADDYGLYGSLDMDQNPDRAGLRLYIGATDEDGYQLGFDVASADPPSVGVDAATDIDGDMLDIPEDGAYAYGSVQGGTSGEEYRLTATGW